MKTKRSLSSFRTALLGLTALALPLLVPDVAFAGSNDEQAKQLSEQALFDDYLNLNFEAAKQKLVLASNLCRSDCSPSVKARVFVNLGIVYVAGLKNRDEGVASFIKAIQADPGVELDPDLSNEEISGAFEEARGLAGGGEAPSSEPAEPVDAGEGVTHTPPREQAVNTPLPLSVAVDEDTLEVEVRKVEVHFRGFGMARYKTTNMEKLEDGVFGVELSCRDVGSSAGKLEYYLVIYDDEGNEVTQVGSDSSPMQVQILNSVASPPPPLPGRAQPTQCDMPSSGDSGSVSFDTNDCPPDFPGCGSDPEEEEDLPPEGAQPRHWFSIGFQQDFLMTDAVTDPCSSISSSGLECFYPGSFARDASVQDDLNNDGFLDQGDLPLLDANMDNYADNGGATVGGFKAATQRVMLGYEFAVSQQLLIGGKLGFAFGGGPTLSTASRKGSDFLPLHAEARGTYRFGDYGSFFRPQVTLAVGAAQVDAKEAVWVVDSKDPSTGAPYGAPTPVLVDVWKKTGQGFGSGGIGTFLGFGDNHGLLLEARGMFMLGSSGIAMGLQGGYTIGF